MTQISSQANGTTYMLLEVRFNITGKDVLMIADVKKKFRSILFKSFRSILPEGSYQTMRRELRAQDLRVDVVSSLRRRHPQKELPVCDRVCDASRNGHLCNHKMDQIRADDVIKASAATHTYTVPVIVRAPAEQVGILPTPVRTVASCGDSAAMDASMPVCLPQAQFGVTAEGQSTRQECVQMLVQSMRRLAQSTARLHIARKGLPTPA